MLQSMSQSTQLRQIAHVLAAEEDHAADVLTPQDPKKLLWWSFPAFERQQKLLSHSLFQRHSIFRNCTLHSKGSGSYGSPAKAFVGVDCGSAFAPPIGMKRAIARAGIAAISTQTKNFW